jgi:protein-S-isoprenylcysteine O-methyltransferase Ste14
MTHLEPDFLVRAAALYFPITAIAAVLLWSRPERRVVAAAFLAWFFTLPTVLLLHVVAVRAGWWRFEARGGLLLGMPADLFLAWTLLWGALPPIALRRAPVALVAGGLFAVDLVLMPMADPVVQLGPSWLVGEAIGLAAVFAPAFCLARWTIRGERLAARAVLQVIAFSGLLVFVLPAIIIEASGSELPWLRDWSLLHWSLLLQSLGIPAIVGLSAVQEFVTRGGGTPVPFDPPRRLVTTGVYAYVRNPMQLSAAVVLVLLGVALRSAWIAAGGVMAHLYSAGLAGWDEHDDLIRRFGERWTEYRSSVSNWIPRWRPWHAANEPPAKLFVSESCRICREVADWFESRSAAGLEIMPAESHPAGLTRVTYEPADGGLAETGVAAIGRALEHIHVGWTVVGMFFRLPLVRFGLQTLIDASGGGPRILRSRRHAPSR